MPGCAERSFWHRPPRDAGAGWWHPNDGSGSHGAGPRMAPGAPNARPDRRTRCGGRSLKTTSGAVPVEILLISAVRTHALGVHTQAGRGGRRPAAIRHESAAHRLHRAAHTLHRHAYAALSRPREIHPRNPHLRRRPERETAGQAPAPLHEVRAQPAVLVAGAGFEPATFGL